MWSQRSRVMVSSSHCTKKVCFVIALLSSLLKKMNFPMVFNFRLILTYSRYKNHIKVLWSLIKLSRCWNFFQGKINAFDRLINFNRINYIFCWKTKEQTKDSNNLRIRLLVHVKRIWFLEICHVTSLGHPLSSTKIFLPF